MDTKKSNVKQEGNKTQKQSANIALKRFSKNIGITIDVKKKEIITPDKKGPSNLSAAVS